MGWAGAGRRVGVAGVPAVVAGMSGIEKNATKVTTTRARARGAPVGASATDGPFAGRVGAAMSGR